MLLNQEKNHRLFGKIKHYLTNKRVVFILLAVLIVLFSICFYFFSRFNNSCSDGQVKTLPVISKAELSLHDGVKNNTIFIGYNCLVYDVTSSKAQYYGDGQSYHYLVGKDSTKLLNIFGGTIIKTKYKVVGVLGN